MQIALRMAAQGLGTAAPNPAVGAVIVRFDPGAPPVVVARGVTQPGGRPHAETEALQRAGAAARGATLYVTLEPCAHTGKTPPCADAVIAAGLARVVVAIADPDHRVAGRGIARLRAAGIAVTLGVGAAAARWLTLGHIRRVTAGRPFVQLKLAVDRHGRTPLAVNGKPQFVSGPEARAQVHLMRAKVDAILTGIGTVLADDPDLTCRLPGLQRSSLIRVVLDPRGRLPATSRLARSAPILPLWLVTAADARPVAPAASRHIAIGALDGGGRPDLAAVLSRLATDGITRLMVEAGPRVAGGFLNSGCVDEVVVLQSREIACDNQLSALPFAGAGLDALAAFQQHDERTLGADRMIRYRCQS